LTNLTTGTSVTLMFQIGGGQLIAGCSPVPIGGSDEDDVDVLFDDEAPDNVQDQTEAKGWLQPFGSLSVFQGEPEAGDWEMSVVDHIGGVAIGTFHGFGITFLLQRPPTATDVDGDNRLDSCDDCPNDPAKFAPGVCGCGTSDNNIDTDGNIDCNPPPLDVTGSPCCGAVGLAALPLATLMLTAMRFAGRNRRRK
jgi:hypothetical protein